MLSHEEIYLNICRNVRGVLTFMIHYIYIYIYILQPKMNVMMILLRFTKYPSIHSYYEGSVILDQISTKLRVFLKKVLNTIWTRLFHFYSQWRNYKSKVKLAILVEGDSKDPFSIATRQRGRRGGYSISWITPLYLWFLQRWELSKAASSTIFWVFDMTRPGIEPRSPGPLANTLLIRPMAWYFLYP